MFDHGSQSTSSNVLDKTLTESDPNGLDAHAPGAKLDAGKPRVALMLSGFARALEEVARVTTVGASKYTPDGWAEVPNGIERYDDAHGRHLLARGRGERIDADTQCHHRAQIIWNALAAFELELRAEANAEEKEFVLNTTLADEIAAGKKLSISARQVYVAPVDWWNW